MRCWGLPALGRVRLPLGGGPWAVLHGRFRRSVRSRWSWPGSGAWAPWSPFPAGHSRGLTHELTLAARLPAGLALHSPGRPGPRLLPALSCPLFSRFLLTLWVKLSRPKHEESVPAHPVCPPRPAGSEDVVATPAGPVLCVGARRAELVLGCAALPPSQHVAGSSSGREVVLAPGVPRGSDGAGSVL